MSDSEAEISQAKHKRNQQSIVIGKGGRKRSQPEERTPEHISKRDKAENDRGAGIILDYDMADKDSEVGRTVNSSSPTVALKAVEGAKSNWPKFNFIIKDSIKSLYSIAKNKSRNELNLFTGSFYFSSEFFKFLLEERNLPISIHSLKEVL